MVLFALLIGFIGIWGGAVGRFRIGQPPLSSKPESSELYTLHRVPWGWDLGPLLTV